MVTRRQRREEDWSSVEEEEEEEEEEEDISEIVEMIDNEEEEEVSSDISSSSSNSIGDKPNNNNNASKDKGNNNITDDEDEDDKSRKLSKDSGIQSGEDESVPAAKITPSASSSSVATSSSSTSTISPMAKKFSKTSRNVQQIEALLRRINEENRKTKEVLDTITRSSEHVEETTTKVRLSRSNIISLRGDNTQQQKDCEDEAKNKASEASLCSTVKPPPPTLTIESMLYFETSMEGSGNKKTPLVMFNCGFLSNPPEVTVGQKYRLSFKTVNADAKLISQVSDFWASPYCLMIFIIQFNYDI